MTVTNALKTKLYKKYNLKHKQLFFFLSVNWPDRLTTSTDSQDATAEVADVREKQIRVPNLATFRGFVVDFSESVIPFEPTF